MEQVMHELSIAMSILEVAEEEAERRGGVRVEAIHLKIGPLSGVVNDSLVSAFQLAAEQTEFEHSRLVIEEVPIAVLCSKCESERPVNSVQDFRCVECGTPASVVVRGRELLLAALELAE
jgi:hydrogenase nickel incorporation protein HypA/HybF